MKYNIIKTVCVAVKDVSETQLNSTYIVLESIYVNGSLYKKKYLCYYVASIMVWVSWVDCKVFVSFWAVISL